MIRFQDQGHLTRLRRLASHAPIAAAGTALLESAADIAEDARFSILDGAISGKGHIPSAPGSPPNADTHDLDQSIHVGELIETPGRIQTAVIADSDHALHLELGTVRMAARPFMVPALTKGRAGILQRISSAIDRAIRSK